LFRRSRATFHIWPHALHRQYVKASIFVLAAPICGDVQNGHAVGATAATGSARVPSVLMRSARQAPASLDEAS
jgi:hypothetical protein